MPQILSAGPACLAAGVAWETGSVLSVTLSPGDLWLAAQTPCEEMSDSGVMTGRCVRDCRVLTVPNLNGPWRRLLTLGH